MTDREWGRKEATAARAHALALEYMLLALIDTLVHTGRFTRADALRVSETAYAGAADNPSEDEGEELAFTLLGQMAVEGRAQWSRPDHGDTRSDPPTADL